MSRKSINTWINSYQNKEQGQQKTVMNMVDINPIIPIITLTVKCLNVPIKRQIFRVDQKLLPNYIFLLETYFKYRYI